MPKFKVETQSKYPADETFKKIKEMLETDGELRKLDTYTTSFNEQQMTGSAKGNKFQADMTVKTAGDGSHVAIEVNLPLMLTPVKGLVQSTLEKKLTKTLA